MISKCEPVPIIPMYWSVIIEFDAGYTQLQASPADLQHLLPCTAVCSRESGSRIRRHIAHFKFNELLCFKRLLSIQCEVSGLQIRQICCSINCTSLQDPGLAGGMLELQLKKTYLFCRVQGRRSKVFLCSAHLCRSQMGRVRLFRRIAATGLSLDRIRSC